MSTSNETDMSLVCVLASTGLLFFVHHTYCFDGCRCLLPNKKDWFRVLLTWMIIMSFVSLLIWGGGFLYVKLQLGWSIIPGYGPMPYPNALWTKAWRRYNVGLTFWVNFAYSLQICLNAEEGLYWYHLMRAVRHPKSAKAWLTSSFFYSWILICALTVAAVFVTSWVGHADMVMQSARTYTVCGALELVVVLASSIVIFKFPSFLGDVKISGAGPQVRSRLHFYHANKARTFFRIIFALTSIIMGVDGLTAKKRIDLNPIAFDMLQQIAFTCYFFAGIISIVLYLPRNWSGPNATSNIMVAQHYGRGGADQLASNALMSLLREAGQWDDHDDEMVQQQKTRNKPSTTGGAKGAFVGIYTGDNDGQEVSTAPRALENWISPLAVQTTEDIPVQLRINVVQEVHEEGVDTDDRRRSLRPI